MSEANKKNTPSKKSKLTTKSKSTTSTTIPTSVPTTTTNVIKETSITKSEETPTISDNNQPKFTPGSYVSVKQTTFISGKVWKQPKERFSVKKTDLKKAMKGKKK
ncbi:predicted protein [Naegleria gruberi]|uniref:Predicted protein n=1 Tax=Naegleria gruberi TaxID=5762 RepID=D2UXF4_NAEGR|nr:uncharacterized protein NAEGRDRAFT_61104 [Naegleria gruberi]EFC50623.1 predicted protein [Naegleria gruberi]|eukprot:XP_002683367.1 predicted protein [Naegleria gruberi strain NEG-M]